ncbi:hypothetical protein LTR10_000278 [Elasticomyces elasticus]|nr:hypothetical protein LTR10_000278 [Elasticomyces elasticus]
MNEDTLTLVGPAASNATSDDTVTHDTTMDDFGEEIETLYLDSIQADTVQVTTYYLVPEFTACGRLPTSFLDLPGELRNAVYQLLFRRDRQIRIGFKYSGDLIPGTPGLGQGAKPIYHGVYSSHLVRSDSGVVCRSAIKEKLPPIAQASPLLKREVLEIYYSDSRLIRLPLRNFLDRRLFRQWAVERGSLLKGVKEVKLQMPHIRVRRFQSIIYVNSLGNGAVFVGTRDADWVDYRGARDCKCLFGSWVEMILEVNGRHPEYDDVRALDVGPVMQAVIKICEAVEYAEAMWEIVHPPGSAQRREYELGCRRFGALGRSLERCLICMGDAVWTGWNERKLEE